MADTKIILYTNHRCPWAHRAHIALAELKVPFTEEIVDLDVPRTPEYLKVNPRGLVPSLSYNGQILTESAVVATFLADAYPSHLAPPSNTVEGALLRARINFFVDTYFTKFHPQYIKAIFGKSQEEVEQATTDGPALVLKELEPLLANAKPFFGGSDHLTLAEVLTGPFILRLVTFSKSGLIANALFNDLKEKAPNFYNWAQAVAAHPSVTGIFDGPASIETLKKRIAKARGQAA